MRLTNEQIALILALIDEWATQIERHDLNDQCRRSGRSFFDYMGRQGVDRGYMATLIQRATGYNPRQLWTVDDAWLLRSAIARYEAAESLARQDDRGAQFWADWMWRRDK